MRGENHKVAEQAEALDGPSPRAWGKLLLAAPVPRIARTIPTCVGKTPYRQTSCGDARDHPHVRGENDASRFHAVWRCGPSPRAWGKQYRLGLTHLERRTIPTCVGKTRRRAGTGRAAPDHPHVRGENPVTTRCTMSASGPSPRAWGKQWGHLGFVVDGRTIPTCVGKTRVPARPAVAGADHPHVRGENAVEDVPTGPMDGPSPRAWGKRESILLTGGRCRTIPTCVGKTPRWAKEGAVEADHPHVRGENTAR